MISAADMRKLSTDPNRHQKMFEAVSAMQLVLVEDAVRGATTTTVRLSVYPDDVAQYVIKQLKDRGYNVDHRDLGNVKVSW